MCEGVCVRVRAFFFLFFLPLPYARSPGRNTGRGTEQENEKECGIVELGVGARGVARP